MNNSINYGSFIPLLVKNEDYYTDTKISTPSDIHTLYKNKSELNSTVQAHHIEELKRLLKDEY